MVREKSFVSDQAEIVFTRESGLRCRRRMAGEQYPGGTPAPEKAMTRPILGSGTRRLQAAATEHGWAMIDMPPTGRRSVPRSRNGSTGPTRRRPAQA
jgi:hypothetical protein